MSLSHAQLRRWYADYNARWFGGRLPADVDVFYAPDDGAHGVAICDEQGNRCIKIDTPEFLSIDHVGDGGGKHRKQIKGSSIYVWLAGHEFPKGFATLCLNCNMSRGFYGYCPHAAPQLAIKNRESATWRRFA